MKELVILQNACICLNIFIYNLPPMCSWRGSALPCPPLHPVLSPASSLAKLLVGICLYNRFVLFCIWWPLQRGATRCLHEHNGGKREHVLLRPASLLSAWKCFAEGMVSPGLPSTSAESPRPEGWHFQICKAILNNSILFFFFLNKPTQRFSETDAWVVP